MKQKRNIVRKKEGIKRISIYILKRDMGTKFRKSS